MKRLVIFIIIGYLLNGCSSIHSNLFNPSNSSSVTYSDQYIQKSIDPNQLSFQIEVKPIQGRKESQEVGVLIENLSEQSKQIIFPKTPIYVQYSIQEVDGEVVYSVQQGVADALFAYQLDVDSAIYVSGLDYEFEPDKKYYVFAELKYYLEDSDSLYSVRLRSEI